MRSLYDQATNIHLFQRRFVRRHSNPDESAQARQRHRWRHMALREGEELRFEDRFRHVQFDVGDEVTVPVVAAKRHLLAVENAERFLCIR